MKAAVNNVISFSLIILFFYGSYKSMLMGRGVPDGISFVSYLMVYALCLIFLLLIFKFFKSDLAMPRFFLGGVLFAGFLNNFKLMLWVLFSFNLGYLFFGLFEKKGDLIFSGFYLGVFSASCFAYWTFIFLIKKYKDLY